MTILIKNPNFLILDEPTNDLDIATLSVLEDFLMNFQGCVLIVTHDRYFMDKLVDHLFVFEGNGLVRDFPGNYTEYRDRKELEEKAIASGKPLAEEKKVPEQIVFAGTKADELTAGKRKPTFKEKFEYEQLEKEIAALEKEKSELSDRKSVV